MFNKFNIDSLSTIHFIILELFFLIRKNLW